MGLVVGYLAMSLDGFIAGPEVELAWLEAPRGEVAPPFATGAWASTVPDGLEFDDFIARVGQRHSTLHGAGSAH